MDYEHLLEQTYSRFLSPGDTVIDVGAYLGRHSKAFSKLVGPSGQVYCFEALLETFVRLAIDTMELPNTTLVNLALGDSRGMREFIHAVGMPEESGLKKRFIYNAPDQTVPVASRVWCETLDHFCGEMVNPRYIKIDVEGAELNVLKGGENLIQRSRPIVSVEWGLPTYKAYDQTPLDLWDWCDRHGYRIYDINLRKIEDFDFWNHLCEIDQTIWDFWLVPFEREEDFASAVSD